MSVTSPLFLFLFFPVTLAGYYLLRGELRNLFLVAASLLFYWLNDRAYAWLLPLSIAVNYLFGLLMERHLARADALGASAGKWQRRLARLWLAASLLFNFGLLFYYKYYVFSLETAREIFHLDVVIPVIGLPLGISFFTFRTVSYCLDIFWRTAPAQKNPLRTALYVSFFPQVTMGPITAYSAFSGQLRNRSFDFGVFAEGVKQIIIGLFKKLVFANGIGAMVDHAFAMPHESRTVLLAWMGILGYLVQLYYDFSGYSDMAIGLGKLFGFETPKNFDYPYASRSVGEYWGRWHITLGTWLKHYLYTPVLRAVTARKRVSIFAGNLIAIFATWLFSGLWHGAAWHYVVWGLYQFALLALERTVEYHQKKRRKRLKLKKQPETRLHVALGHIYFMIALILGQLLFRVDTLGDYLPYFQSMFGLGGHPLVDTQTLYYWTQNAALLIVGGFLCFPILPWLDGQTDRVSMLRRVKGLLLPVIYLALAVIGISYVFTSTYQAFIYFQF